MLFFLANVDFVRIVCLTSWQLQETEHLILPEVLDMILFLVTFDILIWFQIRLRLLPFPRRPHLVGWYGALGTYALASDSLNTFDIASACPKIDGQ
jgi:hypothetical protein